MLWSFVVAACLATLIPSASSAADTSENSLPISPEPSEPTTPSFCIPGLAQLLPKSALVTEKDFEDAEILPIDYEDPDFLNFLNSLTEADTDTPPALNVVRALEGRKGEDTRKDVECAVCYGCLDAESLATPDCGHNFHDWCLKLVRSGRCPLCNIPVKASDRDFGRDTAVKKMLRVFAEKKWTLQPLPREPEPTPQTLDNVPEAAEFLKARARYHTRAYRAAMYEMTKGIRAAAGANLKHLIGGLLSFAMRRLNLNQVVEVVDRLVYGPFGCIEERHKTFLNYYVTLHEMLTLAGASPQVIAAQLPAVPNPENLVALHDALHQFDRLNYSFGMVICSAYDGSPLMLPATSLQMILAMDRSYDWLARRMSPVWREEDLGVATRNYLQHKKLLDRMRDSLSSETVFDFTTRYLQPDIYGEAEAIRRSELLFRIESW